MNTLDLNKNMIHNVSRVHSIMNETIFIEQSEDEYAVQTLAFNFKNENSEFILQKFGILIESNELYIEYLVNDEYFINKSIEESKLKLDETSLEIKEILLSQEITKNFISSHNITNLTISFSNGMLEDILIFKYGI